MTGNETTDSHLLTGTNQPETVPVLKKQMTEIGNCSLESGTVTSRMVWSQKFLSI